MGKKDVGDLSEIRIVQLCKGNHPSGKQPGGWPCAGVGTWGINGGGIRSAWLHVSSQNYGHTHYFRICSGSELCERKEVELWRLRQSLVNSIFSTGRRIKGKYDGVLHDSYFERI